LGKWRLAKAIEYRACLKFVQYVFYASFIT
jgi:hypothetical protein